MARLPYVDPEASETVRKTFEELPFQLNIVRMVAHAETCLRPMLRLGQAILTAQQLDPLVRELSILLVAVLSEAEYEWVQHEPIAVAVGATAEQVDALRRRDLDSGAFDERQRVALRLTAQVVLDADADDETFAAAAEVLPPRELIELILAIGYYMTLARVMTVARIDPDAPAGVALDELE